MKSYKLVFGDTIPPIIKTDIERLIKIRTKQNPQKDADVIYKISDYGGVPYIEKQNRVYDQEYVKRDILFKDHLWNQFLFHIKKTPHTSIIPSSFLYEDISLIFSYKLRCASELVSDTDNLIIVGNDVTEIQLKHIRDNYNANISMVSLFSNIPLPLIEYYDIIHIINTDYSNLLEYNNVNVIDVADIVSDIIISDFYSM
jgi:hypothetical protein